RLVLKALPRPTPFAFPLMVERFREQLSNESVADRIARIVQQLEKAAGQAPGVGGAPSQDAAQVRESLAFGQEGAAGAPTSSSGKRASRRKPSRPLPPL
ncbi:MAG: DNA ligase-associated DEXH box helicase, partial [Polaromonas sp.]|nr:DNA ligase-associated DEXH box helicase [Polaromonas sp.]